MEFSHQSALRFLQPRVSSCNVKRLYFSKIMSEATPGGCATPGSFEGFVSRDWTGNCCKVLSQSIKGTLSTMFPCCAFVLPVTLSCLKQCFVAGSPVISGLGFDAEGREQGCRNPGNLTVQNILQRQFKTCTRNSKKDYLICQNKLNYFNGKSCSFLLNLSLNLSILVFIIHPYLLLYMPFEAGSYLWGLILVMWRANTSEWYLSFWRTLKDKDFCPHRKGMLNHFPI